MRVAHFDRGILLRMVSCIILYINYAPNFEEVEGAYWFEPVWLSVRYALHSVKNGKRWDLEI